MPNANNIIEIIEPIKEFNVINPNWFLKMCNGDAQEKRRIQKERNNNIDSIRFSKSFNFTW